MHICQAKERLPTDYRSRLPMGQSGVLVTPDRGLPIHPQSLDRFAKVMCQGRPAYYVPEIPVATELGLPKYPPLLYWLPLVPSQELLSNRIRHWLGRESIGRAPEVDIEAIVNHPDVVRVTETTKEEQVHYFADHFPAVCPKPIQVSVVVSNTCNLKCVMCPYHSPEIKPQHQTDFFSVRQQMPWEYMEWIAKECGEMKVGVKVGNIEEPLMHPRIVDFVRLARSEGAPSFHITTNGLLLPDERIRELLEAGLTSMFISMDAARPETYKRVRGADLARVEANVRRLIEIRDEMKKTCYVRTAFVKNRGVSIEEADEFRERWIQEVDGVILYNLAEFDRGNSKFVEVNRFVEDKMQEAGERWPCLNPFQEIYLLPDSRVYYCCETVSKLAFQKLPSMGTFPEQSMREIWAGEMFHNLRRDLILNKLDDWSACQDCSIWMAHVGKQTREGNRLVSLNMITEVVDKVA